MTGSSLSHRLGTVGRAAWRTIAPASLRRAAQPLVRRMLLRRIEGALSNAPVDIKPGPLIVSGLLAEAKGVSEGARLSLAGFRAAGFDPVAHDLRPMFARGADAGPLADFAGGVWFVHVNAPEAIHALGRLNPAAWRGRYRIGYWAYELPRVPAEWVGAARAFDEIWTPSRFVAEALRASGIGANVRVMPHPVSLGPQAGPADRAAFGIPADSFAVLVMADLQSSAARKNLAGAMDIYLRAFPEAGQAQLVVKLRETGVHPRVLASARQAAAGRPDIRFMTDDLSGADMRRLIASSSLVLSPHRSEGFGLPLAEAFLAGVPALATGWSGNMDFMSDLPDLLIASRLIDVHDPYGVYRAREQQWADPDLADGAARLRTLAASAQMRAGLAERGKQAVEALAEPWRREALMLLPFARHVLRR